MMDLSPDQKYLVGIAVFCRHPEDKDGNGPWQLPVVKRAENENVFPNNRVVPGGYYLEAGETVRETVNREKLEETGLVVETVMGEFHDLFLTSRSSRKINI